jgi:predicted permease
LLRLHPRGFQAEFGAAMEETLARRTAEAHARGGFARARFWTRETSGLLGSLFRERLGAAGARRRGLQAGRRFNVSEALMVKALVREARHGVRRLLRSPGFALAGVVTLGLAIGANAAIFTVVERVVLSPLPYGEPDRIVYLDHGARGLDRPGDLGMTTGLYWQYAGRARTLEDVVLYQGLELTETGAAGAANRQVTQTTPSFARALGVTPALGRWFDEAEGAPGGRRVAILSHGLWLRRFGGDPEVLGQPLNLSGTTYEVIGVMPRGFAFPDPATELWIAHQLDASVVRVGSFSYGGIARLADGATLADARAELDRLIARLPQDFPGDESAVPIVEQAGTFSNVMPLREWVVGSTDRTLWILLGAVGIVLLVACANVANLFLVRAEGRQREVAVRRVLGAGRQAIAAFHLAETLVLALAGGALGFVLAVGGVKLLVAFGPADLPRLHEVRVDAAVLVFTLLVSVLAAVGLGAVPLLRRNGGLAAALHESGRANTVTGVRMRARNLLMGAQVALAVILLIASGLMAKSFQRMRAVDPGYDAANALLVRIGLSTADYPSRASAALFHEQLLARVRALPGVVAATATTCPPLSSYCHGDPVTLPDRPWDKGDLPPIASFRRVADGYFSTMGIGLVRGRVFDARDYSAATRAIVVDERMAALYFPGEDALGKQIVTDHPDEEPYEVVGIVNHVLTWGVTSTDRPPQIYFPLLSHTADNTPTIHRLAYIVRPDGQPLDLVPAMRRAVGEVDGNVALALVTTLDGMLAADRAPMAFTMTLVGGASAVALVLGLIGIYGVISYIVAQRSPEIGVRLALGARPGDVAVMILRQGGRVALAGLVVGLAFAAAGSRLLKALLFDVSATDPLTYTVVATGLLGVALLACWVPARRAARLDPLQALGRE